MKLNMDNSIINVGLLKQIHSFLKDCDSLRYLDPNIFDNIDKSKGNNNVSFVEYYLEYINSLPKLDFESVVKISREVYQLYGKEKEFDRILENLKSSYSIDKGTLNKDDDNCITKASESRVLLSGTCYDVVLLCHEIGHKLRFDGFKNSPDIMDSFFFETPSIILEFTASDYLRDNYGIDIKADELRKAHILSIKRENCIENNIFQIVISLLKEKRLNIINLYKEFIKNSDIVEYFNKQGSSIKDCIDEGMTGYSYDIGYILGEYVNNSNNRVELLNMLLKYKDNGINMPFTIEEEIVKAALGNPKHIKH